MSLNPTFYSGARARASLARARGARRMFALLGALAACWAWSAPALAGDGVLEINQTCAVQTGCFAGDAAGLPVTINGSAGRSYRLTSDLVVPNENTDGIVVSTADVGIDLNNFSIGGPVVCSGTPLTCTPNSGTGSGVEVTTTGLSGISVRNGSIRGMGSHGVYLGIQSEVMNVRVRTNRLNGIQVFAGSNVSGNTAYRNGLDGILAGVGSTVSGNTAYLNGADGILASSGSTVSGNTAYDNERDGIVTNSGVTIWGNTVRGNTGFGLNLGSQSGYRENVISNNTAGTVSGAPFNLGNNLCNGVLCP